LRVVRVVAIAGSANESFALKNDVTVWAWGNNGHGQLGKGVNKANSNVPMQVSGLTGVVSIAAGGASLALKSDGTVWAWGAEYLGNGTTAPSNVPVEVRD
jgi:hypothetical protein